MSSGKIWERIFALEASVKKLVHDGKRTPQEYVEALQAIVDKGSKKFTLYLAPGQENGGVIYGGNLERHLNEEELYERCLSLEDEVVQGWLADSSSYPEEFKGKRVFLWKSQEDRHYDIHVACLYWDRRVLIDWRWLGDMWGAPSPALLVNS